MIFKITKDEVKELLNIDSIDFPKYSTQLINLVNQNAQGTRPKVVGQMSDLIVEFGGNKIDEWERWYKQHYPDSIEMASEKIYEMITKFKKVIKEIDKELVESWVRDLVIVKTFIGLKFQEAILKKMAMKVNQQYRLATYQEESKGVDGFIGSKPVSIKPVTYKSMKGLSENIEINIVYYEKVKDGIKISYEEL